MHVICAIRKGGQSYVAIVEERPYLVAKPLATRYDSKKEAEAGLCYLQRLTEMQTARYWEFDIQEIDPSYPRVDLTQHVSLIAYSS